MKLVRLASQIARLASLYPVSTAAITLRPRLRSSRMRSLISTLASTAAPIVMNEPGDPRQGERGIKPRHDAEQHQHVEHQRNGGIDPEPAIARHHQRDHCQAADHHRQQALCGSESAAKVRPHGAFLDDREVDPAARPERSAMARLLALSDVKLPEICARPPRIGSLILGAESTSPSRMMAKGLPTFSRVSLANLAPPCASKVMLTTFWLFGRIDPGLRARQIAAADAAPAAAPPRTGLPCGVPGA